MALRPSQAIGIPAQKAIYIETLSYALCYIRQYAERQTVRQYQWQYLRLQDSTQHGFYLPASPGVTLGEARGQPPGYALGAYVKYMDEAYARVMESQYLSVYLPAQE